MHDDGALFHRGEGNAIINGCTDREKKSYCFANGCPMRASEHQESELSLSSNQKLNNSNNAKINRCQLRLKGGKMRAIILICNLAQKSTQSKVNEA